MTWSPTAWAHIAPNGKVFEIIGVNPEGRYHDGLTFVDISGNPDVQVGWSYDGAHFSPPPPPPPPTLADQARALLADGLTITSAATPALNGTYSADTTSQAQISALMTGLNSGLGFPMGLAALPYADVTGAPHMFTPADFKNFAAAVENFVYATAVVIHGFSTVLPDASTTIP